MAKRRGTNDDDQLTGTPLSDKIFGFEGDDILIGLAGNDTIYGYYGSDVLLGGPGKDSLFGDDQPDRLVGSGGNDYLDGGDHADVLLGGGGHDFLAGSYGADKLYGGRGSDKLFGGYGRDLVDLGRDSAYDVVLLVSDAGTDTILNFTEGTDYVGLLTDDIGRGGRSALIVTNDIDGDGMAEAVGTGAQLVFDSRTLKLWWDADGAGGAAADLIAVFDRATSTFDEASGPPLLGVNDFEFYL